MRVEPADLVVADPALGLADDLPLGVSLLDLVSLGAVARLYPALRQRVAIAEFVEQQHSRLGSVVGHRVIVAEIGAVVIRPTHRRRNVQGAVESSERFAGHRAQPAIFAPSLLGTWDRNGALVHAHCSSPFLPPFVSGK